MSAADDQKIRHYCRAQLSSLERFESVQGAVKRTCALLADLRPQQLQHLNIGLRTFLGAKPSGVLAPFAMLRNVNFVEFRKSETRQAMKKRKMLGIPILIEFHRKYLLLVHWPNMLTILRVS